MKLKDSLNQIDDTWKLNQKLRQVRSRIAELQKKEKYINDQLVRKSTGIKEIINNLPPFSVVEAVEEAEEVLVEQPRRRGRRKLNETE